MPFISLLLALACTALTAQKEPERAPGEARQVLFDFKAERRSVPHRIPLATQRAVLSKMFRKYLTDDNKCSSTASLQVARNAGQIVPAVVDLASGSFTGPGKSETAYVIFVNECNASHAENFGTKRVGIFSGQRLIADVDVDFKSSILRLTDLNNDGVNELLMSSGDMNQGTLIEMAALLEFQNGRLRIIEDFGIVIEDSCASLARGSSSKASVLSFSNVVPGKMPRLRMENYEASCRKTKRWRFLSTGRMPE
ncbi:MAG TPA: hypothetical protein VGW76_04870 [Pyrinomonadaceae bacterium]|nr:hypothetical protein [Pyrinomonadaceae bacterium]